MSNTDEPVLLTAEDLEGFRNHKKNWNTFIVGFMVASCIGLVLAFAWNETETHEPKLNLEKLWLDKCLGEAQHLYNGDGPCSDLAKKIDKKNPNFFQVLGSPSLWVFENEGIGVKQQIEDWDVLQQIELVAEPQYK